MNIKIKFGIINIVKTWTLIITSLIVFISIIFPVFANEPNLIENSNVFNINLSSLRRNVQLPITLEELGLNMSQRLTFPINKEILIEEYSKFLGIARALGTDFNINIPLDVSSEHEHKYSITGIKNFSGTWDNLTVGRTINLVSEEIYKLTSLSDSKVKLDLLVKDMQSNIYHPLNNVNLEQYCSLLVSR